LNFRADRSVLLAAAAKIERQESAFLKDIDAKIP
jgi:hypothetical protein